MLNIDFAAVPTERDTIERYARGGASREYALPVGRAARENPEAFEGVTGGHLSMLENKGVPVEYAVAGFGAGLKVFAVIRAWNDGIPLEYITELANS
jgi:hypothetical protein